MTCPRCHHENLAGTLFCEDCGEELQAAVAIEAVAADGVGVAAGGAACANCGHLNDADYVVCEACGMALAAPVPSQPEEPAPAAAPLDEAAPERRLEPAAGGGDTAAGPGPAADLPMPGGLAGGPRRGKVKLVVEQGMVLGKQFLLTEERSLIGREDAAEQIFPTIDLSGLDEGYVHRSHAELAFEGTFLFVTHLGGHNRTYVNNRPIADHLPHPVNIGDTLRIGKVLLRVTEA